MFKEEEVIKVIQEHGRINFPNLAREMNVNRDDNRQFSKFLFDLTKKGVVLTTRDREYFAPEVKFTIKSALRLNAKGFGFIDLKEGDEGFEEVKHVFIPASSTNTAMDGDIVSVGVFQEDPGSDKWQGIVKEIVTRKRTGFVGRIVKNKFKELTIKPLDPRITGFMRFAEGELAGVKENFEVKVFISEFKGSHLVLKVEKILGHKDDPSIDIQAAIEDSGIPYVFRPETVEESAKVPTEVTAAEIKGREDLRNDLIVTIDGDDTKDFDDAVTVKKLDNGNYMLGVHIADVTHYVKEGKPLDDEASSRGTSVYLADRVIPMLPETLSNGICSLNPGVDRLVISCEMEIDPSGKTVNHRIFEGVINSKHRLTYQQVNKYYHSKSGVVPKDPEREAKVTDIEDKDVQAMLDDALDLSHIIRKYKDSEGFIDFEIEESKLVINAEGKTEAIIPRERLESEMLIEDFMVRANETVAKHTSDAKLAFIYRVHDKPDLDRVSNLQGVVKVLEIDVQIPHNAKPIEFAKAINQIKETRFDDFMKVMMLRTMAKAIYSPDNIGHFGLASEFYTHFTSPIRRYPDLMVHRMLRTYFFDKKANETKHFEAILPTIAEHSSATEVRAVELERRIADIKKAEFYENYIGESFEGTIISVLGFGFFVEFPNKVDGLVHASTLMDGDYELDEANYTIKSRERKFTIGQKVKATVAATNKDEGKIDLVLTEFYDQWVELGPEGQKQRFTSARRNKRDSDRRGGDRRNNRDANRGGRGRDNNRGGFNDRRRDDRDGGNRGFGGRDRNGGGDRRGGFGNRDGGERRSYGDRDRNGGGERRSYGDRDRNGGGDRRGGFGGGERRSYGDRDRNGGGNRSGGFGGNRDGGNRSGGFGGNRGGSFGGERKSYGDRDRNGGGERRSYGDRNGGGNRSGGYGGNRDGGNRSGSFGGNRGGSFGGERKSYGDRDRNGGGERRSYGDRDRNGGGDRRGGFGGGERRSYGDRDRNGGGNRSGGYGGNRDGGNRSGGYGGNRDGGSRSGGYGGNRDRNGGGDRSGSRGHSGGDGKGYVNINKGPKR